MSGEAPRAEFAQRPVHDLRRLDKPTLRRVRDGVENVIANHPNLDIKPIRGRSPWMRLRVGEHRVLYRPLRGDEGVGIVVARVIDRRDLERAISGL